MTRVQLAWELLAKLAPHTAIIQREKYGQRITAALRLLSPDQIESIKRTCFEHADHRDAWELLSWINRWERGQS
jgi:hypothetical protein